MLAALLLCNNVANINLAIETFLFLNKQKCDNRFILYIT